MHTCECTEEYLHFASQAKFIIQFTGYTHFRNGKHFISEFRNNVTKLPEFSRIRTHTSTFTLVLLVALLLIEWSHF